MLEEAGTDPGASPSPTPSAADGQAEPASSTRPGTPLPRRGILVALGAAVAVMIVAGVGVGLTRGGGIGAGSSPPGSPPTPALGPRPAAPDFAPVRANGQPPSDVMDALVVPIGATPIRTTNYDQGNGPWDRGVSFTAVASSGQLLNFFRFELAANHWSTRTEATARGGPGTQILARHKSSDGYFWQVGVTVRRAPGQPRGVDTPSPFDIRLLQNVEG